MIHAHHSLPCDDKGATEDKRFEILKMRTVELEQIIAERTDALIKEKERTESLLHNILPVEVAKELLKTGSVMPARFEEASILFTVVGKKKFAYDIFGDTINMASRIETAGEEGKINVSAYTYDLIKDQFPCEYRGKINAKGKGDLDMYFVK